MFLFLFLFDRRFLCFVLFLFDRRFLCFVLFSFEKCKQEVVCNTVYTLESKHETLFALCCCFVSDEFTNKLAFFF